jgi:hypothetical protein
MDACGAIGAPAPGVGFGLGLLDPPQPLAATNIVHVAKNRMAIADPTPFA